MIEKTSTLIGGKEITIETGRIARQADGAVQVSYGDTVVLVSACSRRQPRDNVDFFPLTVDYRENYYAAGRIPGGFFKREGKPSEKEVLTSRLIDRPIRPLFPSGYRCDTQIIALVLSADGENDPDIHGITGASAALMVSDIPFETPIAAVRVGLVGGDLVINPSSRDLKESQLNLIVAGSEEGIVMVEAGAREVSEATMVEALAFGHEHIKQIVPLQRELAARLDVRKRPLDSRPVDEKLFSQISSQVSADLRDALDTTKHGKRGSYEQVDRVKEGLLSSYPEESADLRSDAAAIFDRIKEQIFRDDILERKRRPDGREFDAVRPITCEVGLLPRTHGSALFTRGETQALVTATLGTSDDIQKIDIMEGESSKRFLLHYNFPPFSVGETGFMRGPGRREVGHGALAERSILPVVPAEDKFPYTIRIVSDILESNGSSSMASVCGGILALMDAGVPIKAPVAGIAMGLVKEGDRYAVLTDIAGAEDHYGDMDFKVTGTRSGITALQMDIKIGGLTMEIMSEALQQALRGRLFVLDRMLDTISAHRSNTSKYAPKIYSLRIKREKIRDVIGKGGSTIRALSDETGVTIDIDDDGTVKIASTDNSAAQEAIRRIQQITADVEVNTIYTGKVVRLMDFGAFVNILPGRDGLVHISQISNERVDQVSDVLKEGDVVRVKVLEVDKQGRVRLSMKAVASAGA